MNAEKTKTIHTVLLVIACIALIAGLVMSGEAEKERAHNIDDIKIELIDNYTATEGSHYYYVYTDFKVTNNTKATLQYIEFDIHFTDDNGREIGTMNTYFGSILGRGFDLESGASVIKSVYLKESGTNWDNLFAALYENGVSNYNMELEIIEVKWNDDYKWRKE